MEEEGRKQIGHQSSSNPRAVVKTITDAILLLIVVAAASSSTTAS
jgi:hypothetical protein